MERKTAGEPLDGVESEKDPAFKPSWKFSDQVVMDTKRNSTNPPPGSVPEHLLSHLKWVLQPWLNLCGLCFAVIHIPV